MMTDILTIIWKETRSLFGYQSRRGQLSISMLTPLIAAVLFPWQIGMNWVNGYFPLFLSLIIPMLVCGILVPDSFAGERERHTLETLLASRLSDRAILIAKILVSVVFTLAITVFVLLISLITISIVHGEGKFVFYRLDIFAAALTFSLVFSVLAAALGVLISMRSSTVQQAQQTLFSILLIPPMLLGMVPMFILGMSENTDNIRSFLSNLDGDLIVWLVIGVLALIGAGLLMLDFYRFKRERLALD